MRFIDCFSTIKILMVGYPLEMALLSFALSLGLLPVEVYSYIIILIFLLTVVSSSILNMRKMKYIA